MENLNWLVLPSAYIQNKKTDLEQHYALTKLSGEVIGHTNLNGMVGGPQAIDISIDGTRGVSVGSEGDIVRFELTEPSEISSNGFNLLSLQVETGRVSQENINGVVFSEGGGFSYSTEQNETIFYDFDTGKEIVVFDGSEPGQHAVQTHYSFNGSRAFARLMEGFASFEFQDGDVEVIKETPPVEQALRVIISPDGDQVALIDNERIYHRRLPNGDWKMTGKLFPDSDQARNSASLRYVPGFNRGSDLLLAVTSLGEFAVVDHERGAVGATLSYGETGEIRNMATWGADWTIENAQRLFFVERLVSGNTVLSVHQLIDFDTVLTLAEYRYGSHVQTLGFVNNGTALQVIDTSGLLTLPIWTPDDPRTPQSIKGIKGAVVSEVSARYPSLN